LLTRDRPAVGQRVHEVERDVAGNELEMAHIQMMNIVTSNAA
jgi:hypothetical protein